jgi:polar amino acid transport system permease protein
MSENVLGFYNDFLEQWPLIYSGIWATIKLAGTVSVIGFLFSIIVFYFDLSKHTLVRRGVAIYKYFFIGTPLICIIYMLYYGLPSFGVRLSPFEVMVLGFTLNVGAYNAEYMLTAYNGLDKNQVEAASAQGFSDLQVYVYIIIPQALCDSIPALTNQVIYNLKDSSIAFLVEYPELFARMQELASTNFEFLKTYSLTAVFYIILAGGIFLLSTRLGTRARAVSAL